LVGLRRLATGAFIEKPGALKKRARFFYFFENFTHAVGA